MSAIRQLFSSVNRSENTPSQEQRSSFRQGNSSLRRPQTGSLDIKSLYSSAKRTSGSVRSTYQSSGRSSKTKQAYTPAASSLRPNNLTSSSPFRSTIREPARSNLNMSSLGNRPPMIPANSKVKNSITTLMKGTSSNKPANEILRNSIKKIFNLSQSENSHQ